MHQVSGLGSLQYCQANADERSRGAPTTRRSANNKLEATKNSHLATLREMSIGLATMEQHIRLIRRRHKSATTYEIHQVSA